MSKDFSFRALKLVQALSLASVLGVSASAFAETKTITNASYDVSRELYEEVNPAFVKLWKEQKGEDISITQSGYALEELKKVRLMNSPMTLS